MSIDYSAEAIKVSRELQGKLSVNSKVAVDNKAALSIAYTPGVAAVCSEIAGAADKKQKASELTIKGRTIAVVSDGSAVLGLGNIGPEAAMPVMEGKAVLFKEFAGVDAFPICLATQNVDEIVKAVELLAPTFGGINLEDISAPRCFEIERRLNESLNIPVFHDDQHGTAIVTSAAVINAARLLGKELSNLKTVINGAGAAGTAIAQMFLEIGIKDIILCDSKGAISSSRADLNAEKQEIAQILDNSRGGAFSSEIVSLADAVRGRDLFIGVSVANCLSKEMVSSMNKDSIIFAMSNPTPEIFPNDALEAGARIVGTGRSDFDNQINNVLAFPGIFKGALEANASAITPKMQLAAAFALANYIPQEKLSENYVIPAVFDEGVADKVADAVKEAAK